MDKKALELYTLLYHSEGYVSEEELCSQMDIRPRTLRQIVSETRDELFQRASAEVTHKTNHGYLLEASDRNRLSAFLERERAELAEQEYAAPTTQEGRVDYLIRCFLSTRKFQRYEELADRIYTSRTTVWNDLKYVREKLEEYGLSLESRQSQGYRIAGTEKDIRRCIADYFFHNEFAESSLFLAQPMGMFEQRYLQGIQKIVNEVLSSHAYEMTDTGRENLIIHIVISLYRIQSDEYISDDSGPLISREKNSSVYRIAEEIRARIEQAYGISMPEKETDYMMIHLLGSRIFDIGKDEGLITPETMNLVRRIFREIQKEYGIDFFSDIDLFTMLCMHIQPMSDRLKNDVKLRNPLLEDIKTNSPMGYEMAVLACRILKEEFQKEPDEEEAGYLALHFQLAMERKQKAVKKKILVVCASGLGTSRLLQFRIQNSFPDVIEHIESVSAAKLPQIDENAYDMIISTVPLTGKHEIPVVTVKYSLNDDDVANIGNVIHEKDTDVEFARGMISESLFFAHQTFRSPEQVIHFLCEKIAAVTKLPEGFEKSVLEREKLASTDLGSGIAMPHAMTPMMEEKGYLAVCHLKKPLRWGRQKVTYVFLLAAAKENRESLTLFSHVFYELINDRNVMRRLNTDPSFSVLEQELTRLCVARKSEKEESIFQ